jgi:hypothetical protein
LVADDFEDGVVFVEPWPASYEDARTGLSEIGGRAVIDLADDANGGRFAGYLTEDLFDLRDARVSVEVVETAAPSDASVTYVTAEYPNGDGIEIRVLGDTLDLRHLLGGEETVVGQLPYDPVAHRFWALREAGGTLFWETSPDGSSFTARAQAPAPFDVEWVRLSFGAGTWDNVIDPGRAVFDSYNGGVASGSRCAASSLVDDFDDGAVGRVWTRSYDSASCTRQETGGELVITPSDTLTGYCGYQSGGRARATT